MSRARKGMVKGMDMTGTTATSARSDSARNGPTGGRHAFLRRRSLARGAVLAAMLALAACQAELYSGQSERAVNDMITVLAANGIEAERVNAGDGTYGLTVPRGDFARAITLLNNRGLPRPERPGISETFRDDKIVSTPFEERVRFMNAMAQELAGSLTKIAGVVDADVHVNVPEAQPLADERVNASVSAFIYKDPAVDLRGQIPAIKTLITNSLDGLEYEDVAVEVFDTDALAAAGPLATRPNNALSVPVVLGYAVLALVALFLWRRLSGRKRPRARGRQLVGPAE